MTMKWQCLFASMGCLLLALGCNSGMTTDYSDIELVEVSGHVTLDGIPLAGALVSFEASDKTYSSGVTNAKGNYTLMFNSEKSGCTPGEKVVRITMGGGEDSEDPDADQGEDSEGEQSDGVEIPPRFNRESELTATVSSQDREFDFELTTEAPSDQ